MKKTLINYLHVLLTLISISFAAGCGKSFLDVKKDKKQVIPKELADYQALLDNAHKVMNIASSHGLGMIASEQFSISDANWELLTLPYQKNSYLWEKEVYQRETVEDWNLGYKRILYANLVLEGIETVEKNEENELTWNEVKGSALFHRAYNFYQLAQLFCPVYTDNNKNSLYGLPLRTEPTVLDLSVRSTLGETYDRILADLKEAEQLLPTLTDYKTRPSRWAAHALLAKIYLVMQQYENALAHAEQCLAIKGDLLDFNTLGHPKSLTNNTLPFGEWGEGNEEIILLNVVQGLVVFDFYRINVHDKFLNSYADDDWRKYIYFLQFDGRNIFKGNYAGYFGLYFTGLATDEVYLILAESSTRLGDNQKALGALNTLLRNRISGYEDLIDLNGEDLLNRVLEERKKELVFRGVRWEDLRRLNIDTKTQETLTRVLKDVEYQLPPNDMRYIWPIPDDVINLGGIPQNER